jgi:hypothetical protein
LLAMANGRSASTILPATAVAQLRPDLRPVMRRIVGPTMSWPVSLCWSHALPVSAAALTVRKLIVALVGELHASGQWIGITLRPTRQRWLTRGDRVRPLKETDLEVLSIGGVAYPYFRLAHTQTHFRAIVQAPLPCPSNFAERVAILPAGQFPIRRPQLQENWCVRLTLKDWPASSGRSWCGENGGHLRSGECAAHRTILNFIRKVAAG